MNNIGFSYFLRFVSLVAFQVTIFNHINFLGYLNPNIYILYIILYRLRNNRMLYIFFAFLIGLTIDLFSDTGGIHAGASVLIAFIRPYIAKFSFGAIGEYYSVRFNSIDFGKRLTYISLMVLIHSLTLFILEIFNISHILFILKLTLFTSIFTIILCILITALFSPKSK